MTVDEKLDARLDKIEKLQIENNLNWKEHMRRTEANEGRLLHVENMWLDIKSHINKVEGMFILFKYLAGILASTYVIIQIINTVFKVYKG